MDKKKYWKRREQGKRGQGDKLKPKFKDWPGATKKKPTLKAILKRSKRARRLED